VADLAVGLMIAVVRGIVESNTTLHRGQWPGENGMPRPCWRALAGLKVGIYGLGSIGVKIARRVEALEMLVAYHNRRPRSDTHYPYHAALIDLARWADVLVVAARGSAETRHAVDRRVLHALGSAGYVVNIARGTIIDEEALVEALTRGTIAGAALDVFANEPKVSPALLSAPNVIATAHIGGDTNHSEAGIARMVLTNVEACLAGHTLPNRVRETF
jgi:hydroxypyruvate reductase